MASGSELPEYSSQVKRRKIESDVYGVSVHFNIDYPAVKVNRDSPNIDIEGIYIEIWYYFNNYFGKNKMAVAMGLRPLESMRLHWAFTLSGRWKGFRRHYSIVGLDFIQLNSNIFSLFSGIFHSSEGRL